MNPEFLKYLPDEDLAGAIKSPDGQIPGWLAVSELAKRNSVRASAPQPAPQTTVADDVVGQALRSGGIQSGIRPGPIQAPLRPAGGIMAGPSSQPVQHMASGGQVKTSAEDVLGGLGLLPAIAPLDASKYQTKYEAPTQTSMADAQSAVTPLYGKSPDYDASLAEIDKIKSRLKPSGLADYLQNLGAGIAANAGTPLAAGNAMVFANERARIKDQQNLEDAKQLIGLKTNIQNSQQGRQERIAGAIQQYKHVNDQIADNQARMKLEVAKGSAEEAARIDTHNQALQQQRANLLQDGIKDIANPIFAGAMLTSAKQKGDTAAQSFLQDAIATTNKQHIGQKQAESDIEEKRQMKVAEAQKRASLSNIFAEKALEHKYKMEENGIGGSGYQDPSEFTKAIANYELDPRMLTRLNFAQKNAALAAIKQINPDFNGSYYDPVQDARKKALPNGAIGATSTAANTAIAHLGLLGQYGDALKNGDMQAANHLKNVFETKFGKAAPTNFNSVKEQVAGELVSVLKKNGIPDQEATREVRENMKDVNSFDQLHGFIDGQHQILGGKMDTIRDQLKAVPGLKEDDPIFNQVGYTPAAKASLYASGFDPENIMAGKTLQGLKGGFGKPIDHDTAVEFLKASGGDKKKAMRIAKEFGWKVD